MGGIRSLQRLKSKNPFKKRKFRESTEAKAVANVIYGVRLDVPTTILLCVTLVIFFFVVKEVGITIRHWAKWQFWTYLITGRSTNIPFANHLIGIMRQLYWADSVYGIKSRWRLWECIFWCCVLAGGPVKQWTRRSIVGRAVRPNSYVTFDWQLK